MSIDTPPHPSPVAMIPESSQRVQTILLRVYRSLQFCIPLYLLAAAEPGSFWRKAPSALTMGSTMAFGSTVGILTNRDLARRLAAQQGYPLAGNHGRDASPSDCEPLVSRQAVMAWAYVTAFLWAFDAALNLTLVVSDMLRGLIRVETIVGTVILTVVGTLQVVLLFSIGMMCDQEGKEMRSGKGKVRLPDEQEVVG